MTRIEYLFKHATDYYKKRAVAALVGCRQRSCNDCKNKNMCGPYLAYSSIDEWASEEIEIKENG